MGEAPLVRVAVHQGPEGSLQRGALLAGTLDFRAGREAAASGAAPRCTEVLLRDLHVQGQTRLWTCFDALEQGATSCTVVLPAMRRGLKPSFSGMILRLTAAASGAGADGDRGGGGAAVAARPAPRQRRHPQGAHVPAH